MGVEVTTLDAEIARQMGSVPTFDSFCFQAWEEAALAAHDYVQFLLAERETAPPARKIYLSFEIIASSLETMEYLATTCAQAWGISDTPAHMAENAEIRAAFTRMVEGPLSLRDVADLLRLPQSAPRVRKLEDPLALRRAYERVLRNGKAILRDTGAVWLRLIDRARWFRHFPVFFLPKDTYVIDPQENADREAGYAAALEIEDRLLVYALQDGHRFAHEILRERDVLYSRTVARASLDLLSTRNNNLVLTPSSPKPEESRRKIIGALLSGIPPESCQLLRDHGQFFVA